MCFYHLSRNPVFRIPDTSGSNLSMSLARTCSAHSKMESHVFLFFSQHEDCEPEIFLYLVKIYFQSKTMTGAGYPQTVAGPGTSPGKTASNKINSWLDNFVTLWRNITKRSSRDPCDFISTKSDNHVFIPTHIFILIIVKNLNYTAFL